MHRYAPPHDAPTPRAVPAAAPAHFKRSARFAPAAALRASAGAADPAPLIDAVRAACDRLGPSGWADLLIAHGLDIGAADLTAELARPLNVDRSQPGFGDFAVEGVRGIEPGQPARSLLFHAFASPEVLLYRSGGREIALRDFPTLGEVETIENYVYGCAPPTIEDLRARAGDAPLAIVVFASEYRPGPDTVHRKHADMCYSRTGIARIGTRRSNYAGGVRGFLPFVNGEPAEIAVQPCRYGAYLAALVSGRKGLHGPLHFIEGSTGPGGAAPAPHGPAAGKDAGRADVPPAIRSRPIGDEERRFWVPLHKLFDGTRCIDGYDLEVRLATGHINEKIRRAHLVFGGAGHDGGWQEPDISEPPFRITEGIADFSSDPDDGAWLLTPVPHERLVERALYGGKPLAFKVPKTVPGRTPWGAYQSSLNLSPRPSGARSGPEYLHSRHVIEGNGERNLNGEPGVREKVEAGCYWARHYVDYTGDGWVAVECSQLAMEVPRRLAAYSVVASPDYFPFVRQSDLVEWTDRSAPPNLLEAIWPQNPGRPEPLSAQRFPPNLELSDAGFSPTDDTLTAIVGNHGSGLGAQARLRRPASVRMASLPDGAAGVFAPGWDVSYDQHEEVAGDDGSVTPSVTFLTNYGLGSPFVEDSMLCAALSSYWPAVAPDITRTFAPGPRYATATPLTDDVIGIGGSSAWDDHPGPIHDPATSTVEYQALAYGDYVETALAGRFDPTLIGLTSRDEYIARTLTMALVYEALGLRDTLDKAKWSVLSFRRAAPADPDLVAAEQQTGRRLSPEHCYRFEMISLDGQGKPPPDPAKFDRIVVSYTQLVLFFADPSIALRAPRNGDRAAVYERSV